MKTEKAAFAAGCFWGVEHAFRKLEGVVSTMVGYTGGHLKNPTYHDVCQGNTGHAEAVLVEYDPDRISYEKLLEVFWEMHDPTSLNRQGPDVGHQYRSAIFYHTPEQEAAATTSKKALEESGRYCRPIVTEIRPASQFYKAEEYHQCYYEKHAQ
jgi:peptide-methionine (S)-S-oxide reductase